MPQKTKVVLWIIIAAVAIAIIATVFALWGDNILAEAGKLLPQIRPDLHNLLEPKSP